MRRGRFIYRGGGECIAPRRISHEIESPGAISFRRIFRRGAIFRPADLFRDTGRKAFRLCIYEDDRGRLMNAAAWPDSVTVSEWYFKTSSDIADRRQQVNNNDNDNARRPTRPPASSSTSTERVLFGTGTVNAATVNKQ